MHRKAIPHVLIVPNPASDYIYIDVINPISANKISIRVYDMQGKSKAKLVTGNQSKVYVKNWADGMYTVEVCNNGIIDVRKIVIKH